jgi:hypothetical protein
LQEIKIKIMTYLDKKFRDDEDSKWKYKEKLKHTLDSYIVKLDRSEKKSQLIYLREIL